MLEDTDNLRGIDFNPRSPHGERLAQGYQINPATIFQSTLPARGATFLPPRGRLVHPDFNPRSPHGERQTGWTPRSGWRTFQSTLPARGATSTFCPDVCQLSISIHAPRTGSDGRNASKTKALPISIHAPRTGSDAEYLSAIAHRSISIHAPRTGSDTAWTAGMRHWMKFQSTLPARGATNQRRAARGREHISIHAPRTGSDAFFLLVLLDFVDISIHAPRTGSDPPLLKSLIRVWSFQSTLPARGATFSLCRCNPDGGHFNPRSPHGERLCQFEQHFLSRKHFNPRSPHGERL